MAHHALDGPAMHPQDKPVILIADDSRVVRVSLKNILKNDCQLIEAEDGRQAWELLLETPHIQLIFSDLSMPRLDGRGLLRKVRNSEINRIRNIPFIVVTGNEQESGTWDELQDMGATEVVSKPFDPASIVSIVATLISREESESYMLLPEEEAQTEHLPDVLNQQDFMQSASKELSFAIRNKNELAIALLRIDQFDQLEKHYSEPAIEHILLTATEVIRQHIHPDDTMAYFGNGLFAILRPASNAIGTRYIGRRIVEDMMAKQFYLGESDDLISVSIGISAPQIKPGIRLRELLLLAEGRLKAAMDLGGNRVIDKGNDTLTPVAATVDSTPVLGLETHTTSNLQGNSDKSSYLRGDITAGRPPQPNTIDSRQLEEKIQQLQSRAQSLTDENKMLQEQLERWRKQSAESEQLRQRVFELESEQQQMLLKLKEFAANNSELQQRIDTAESERQTLLDGEEDKHITLKQANQFYEQENVRLTGQLEAVSGRAQKAELAYRKSEQLVVSLKDKIKLMRAQFEQTQQQLNLAKQQASQAAAPAPEPVTTPVDIDTDPLLDEETHLENRTDSELAINGFPSSTPVTAEIEQGPVVQLFAEPSALTPAAQQTSPVQPEKKPAKPSEPKNPFQDIPAYRPERTEKEKSFTEPRRPLSSFAIASLILVSLLSLGGGYAYNYWQEGKSVVAKEAADGNTRTASITAEEAQKPRAASEQMANHQGTSARQRSAAPSARQPARVVARQPVTQPVKPAAPASPTDPQGTTLADEEARLQAELTLRQIAEEEFRQRLQEVNQEEIPQTPQAAGESDSINDPVAADAQPAPLLEETVAPTAEPSANSAEPSTVTPTEPLSVAPAESLTVSPTE